MHSYIFILSVLFSCIPNDTKGQERAKTQFQEYSTGVGSFFQTIPVVQHPMEGEIYPNPEFTLSLIQLEDSSEIINVPLRYNVLNQRVEILKDNKVFEVDHQRMLSFEWEGEGVVKFINVQSIPIPNNFGMDGFVEVLHESTQINLYRRYEVEILKANYNVALSTGNKNDTAKLIEKYFIFYNNRLHSFSGKSKELAVVFGENADQAKQFIKKERLKFKKNEDYKKLVEFIQIDVN